MFGIITKEGMIINQLVERMKIKCDYCDAYLNDTDEKCPSCGAINQHLVRKSSDTPSTIEELKAFCESKNMPLEKMRFFIGEDYKEPKAFGIYQNNEGNFVVYKNKADGSRAVRYEGNDEAYAVNELYQKLKEEVFEQKQAGNITKIEKKSNVQNNKNKKSKLSEIWNEFGVALVAVVVVLAVIIFCIVKISAAFDRTPNAGYYKYDNSGYYNDYSVWYKYNKETNNWEKTECPQELSDNYKDYYVGKPDDVESTEPITYTEIPRFSEEKEKTTKEKSDYNFWDDVMDTDDSYDSWSDGWDDDDWDYDYSGWDSDDSNWDSDW